MPATSSLTIIEDKNLRGVLAPANVLSKKLLEDIIDFIELSSPETAKETTGLVKLADCNKSWIPLSKVRALAKKTK